MLNDYKILWNPDLQMWTVYDKDGKVLWSGEKYADAAQFVEDYANRQKQAALGVMNGLSPIQVGSSRG